jgi:hypothetical protein
VSQYEEFFRSKLKRYTGKYTAATLRVMIYESKGVAPSGIVKATN